MSTFKIDEVAFIEELDRAHEEDGDAGEDSPGECIAPAAMAELARQLRAAGAPEGTLEEQLTELLVVHAVMVKAGEEMPSVDAVAAELRKHKPGAGIAAEVASDMFAPIIALLIKERGDAPQLVALERLVLPSVDDVLGSAELDGREDAAQAAIDLCAARIGPHVAKLEERLRVAEKQAEIWREFQARELPCGHKVEDLIGGEGSVTKCGACLAERQAQRAPIASVEEIDALLAGDER